MSNNPPEDTRRVPLTNRMSLVANAAQPISAQVEMPTFGVLGSEGAAAMTQPTAPFSAFTPAEPPVRIQLPPASATGDVLGGSAETAGGGAEIEFQADPGAGEAYLLLQEIETPDGIIYDVSLPQVIDQPAAESGVLGGAPTETLRFPVRRLVNEPTGPTPTGEPGVLGGFEDLISDAIGEVTFKRVLHLLRAPVAASVEALIDEYEGPATMYIVTLDGGPGPVLADANAWRTHFDPAHEYRVLLFIHGFLSDAETSLPSNWMREMAPHYDAMLAYSHPTIADGPVENAAELLENVPEDIRLKVDIIAYSRGGVVARSLVELQPHAPKFDVQRILTCGTPHAGTLLAEFRRWDRLASIGLTASSWLMRTTGAAPLAFVPKMLEFILRAGGQLFFDLPGVNALDPQSEFILQLNTPGDPMSVYRVPYAVVISTFDPGQITLPNFRDALWSLSVNTFIGAPNDLVVDTPSMSSVDLPFARQISGWIHKTDVNHFAYFDDPTVLAFAREFFLGQS